MRSRFAHLLCALACFAVLLACDDSNADPDAMTAGAGSSRVDGGSEGMSDDDDGGEDDDPACDVTAPTACPSSMPTFADVEPILQRRCLSCHSEQTPDGPWPLKTYAHIVTWQVEIRSAMLMCAMPPADSGIEMPTQERKTILEWIRCGAKR